MNSRLPETAARVPVTTPAALLADEAAVVVDLRSPSEFAADHLPGAHNVPLFDDEGRALVGLLYTQYSPEAAFQEGLVQVHERIATLCARVAELADWELPAGDLTERVRAMTRGGIEALETDTSTTALPQLPARPVVLHCWRGGLRSRSVVAFLRGLGLDRAAGLEGGYQAYRKQVLAELEGAQLPRAIVLRGLTGVGKTLVLRALEAQRPGWTIDLEGCAGHRSSLLGMVGLEPVTQKAFESRLATRLREGFPGPVVYEGESRKVGDAIIPAPLWESMRGATNVLLTAPVEVRLRVLMDDYLARPEARPKLREQLAAVEARMSPATPLVELLDAGKEPELVELLLERYYDPLYLHSEKGNRYALEVDSSDPEHAAREIGDWIAGSSAGSN